MAVIMQNYAKACGFILPKVNEEDLGDSDKISAYAKEGNKDSDVRHHQSRTCNSFDPQGEATRAEVSVCCDVL